ncbi:DUF748 domain-containing protein [Chitinibacter bivalviorum]|uniref:DUF748 domain-containing protein n=1 Tax=Chitinibacter bivalviorum TaxID=2739434 RepID=A0A7H9BE09_9NEIS|nr:DUF748 domain-containing protein [Chitinibacter bivalviorum]QLG86859.1 DUF748 domain-containing protein [Chitinibacter bivalviorum]
MRHFNLLSPPGSIRKYLRAALYAGLGLIALGVLSIFALPPLLKPYLEQQASQALHREVRLERIAFNPFLLKIELEGLSIKDQFGEFVRAKSITIDAQLMSIIRGGPVLRELTLVEPKINVVRTGEKSFNFSDLIKSDSPESEHSEPLHFSLNNIQIQQGALTLDDRVKSTKYTLDQFNLALPFVSNLPQRIDEYIQPALSGRINGEVFSLKGQSKPFKDSLDTSLRLSLKDFDITEYMSYTPLPEALAVGKGRLSTELDIVFRQQRDTASLLLNGQVQLSDLQLKLAQQEALQLGKLTVQLHDLKPMLGDFHFKSFNVDALHVLAERSKQGEMNWLALAPKPTSPKASAVAASAIKADARAKPSSFSVKVDDFALKNSKITWRDASVAPALEYQIHDLALSGQHWASDSAQPFPIDVSAQLAQGATVAANIQAATAPLTLKSQLQLNQLQLADLAPYYAPYLNGQLKGALSTQFGFDWQAESNQYQIHAGELRLNQLALNLPKQSKSAVAIAQLELKGIELDSAQHLIQIANLSSQQGMLDVLLLPEYHINLLDFIPTSSTPKSEAKPSKSMQANASPTWRVKLDQTSIADYQIRLEDKGLAKSTPIILRKLAMDVQNLDTQAGVRSQLKFTADGGRGSHFAISGPFIAQPFSSQWQIDFRGADAAYTQPYFSKYLNVSLASGFVDLKGVLHLALEPTLTGSYQGNIGVRQFYALDKSTGDDFLKWKNLSLNGVKTDFSPLKIDIAEIKLNDFFSRLILSANGRFNLQDIVVSEEGATSVTRESTRDTHADAAKKADDAAASMIPIRIGKIDLSGGNIRYSDLLIRPNFTANLTEMGGQIAGISSQNDTRASLDLKGSVDNIAPVQIQGSLNPLAKDIFYDVKGGVKGYELTSASMYSEKYTGFGITKGKMSMEVAYHIENGKLKASNKLFLDQLTLSGDKVDGPDVTKLPVKFALSLLTDRKGQVKLNLPIEGSLDDPEFRIGAIIWQVVGNVLEKIVTAPFDALGAAFSDGPSLSYVTFEPGRARISDAAATSIKQVADILLDRPALKIEVTGWADRAMDSDGIKQYLLRSQMRAVKADKLGKSAESVESEDELNFTEEEKPALIAAVYKKAKFEKPSNLLGLDKKLPVEEMQALILKNTVVSEQDLLAMANLRAKRVEEALKAAGLPAERVFITKSVLDPKPAQSEKDQGPVTRVQFKLE